MCGIVGFCGKLSAKEVVLNGLEKLEYRGYDSAGISLFENGKIKTIKRVGMLSVLEDALKGSNLDSNVGIGHTRWATHGEPSEKNAHPQNSNDGTISIVHNGIIENFMELKEKLTKKGYVFYSDTDTEIVANLIHYYYKNDLKEAFKKATDEISGQYAIAMISSHDPSKMYAIRHDAPLVFGVCKDGNMVSSDVASIIRYTKEVIYLDNDELVEMSCDSFTIFDKEGRRLAKKISLITWDETSATKAGFDHFMLKEIFEQPKLINQLVSSRIKNELPKLSFMYSKEELQSFENIYLVGCGTAYHAGEVGKYVIEKWLKVPAVSEIASEFRFKTDFINEKSLVIFISQSGETADTIAALKEARSKGATTLAITNVVGSSITREAQNVLYCEAGPEISVASTKAYTTQLIVLYFFALQAAMELESLSLEEVKNITKEMKMISGKIEVILENLDIYKRIAEKIKDDAALFYIGRSLDYLTAKEGALKLKELTYIFTEAFPAGELKHGPLALIEKDTPVIALLCQDNMQEKTISNIKEVKARGAYTVAIAPFGSKNVKEVCDDVIFIPASIDMLSPVTAAIPEQLLAYYTSVAKGLDVDKPRNLAKSVTVE